jgi:hypothetical protein
MEVNHQHLNLGHVPSAARACTFSADTSTMKQGTQLPDILTQEFEPEFYHKYKTQQVAHTVATKLDFVSIRNHKQVRESFGDVMLRLNRLEACPSVWSEC